MQQNQRCRERWGRLATDGDKVMATSLLSTLLSRCILHCLDRFLIRLSKQKLVLGKHCVRVSLGKLGHAPVFAASYMQSKLDALCYE